MTDTAVRNVKLDDSITDKAIELGVPSTTVDALVRYVEHRIPTGGFLQAVLSNDLMGAMAKADTFNQRRIFQICSFIYNYLPAACYGSPQAYAQWLAAK